MVEQLDISPQELNLLKEKIKKTNALKQEFLRQAHNPYRHASGEGGIVFDPAFQRFNAVRAGGLDYFKPTWKNGIFAFSLIIVPMITLGALIKWERGTREHKIRTGQISYKDRDFKFQ